MDIKPEVIVQSSLALVVAMTSMEVVRSGLALVESDIPHEVFKYRLITLAIVIFLTILIIKYLAKDCKETKIDTPNPTEISTAAYATSINSFTSVPARRNSYR